MVNSRNGSWPAADLSFKNSSNNCFHAAACTRWVKVITPSRSKIIAAGPRLISISSIRTHKHHRTSGVSDYHSGCTIFVVRPMSVPRHDYKVDILSTRGASQFRPRLPCYDFEFELSAGIESAAGGNTIYELLRPSRPFMLRLVNIKRGGDASRRIRPVLTASGNMDRNYLSLGTLRQVGGKLYGRIRNRS